MEEKRAGTEEEGTEGEATPCSQPGVVEEEEEEVADQEQEEEAAEEKEPEKSLPDGQHISKLCATGCGV